MHDYFNNAICIIVFAHCTLYIVISTRNKIIYVSKYSLISIIISAFLKKFLRIPMLFYAFSVSVVFLQFFLALNPVSMNFRSTFCAEKRMHEIFLKSYFEDLYQNDFLNKKLL